MATDLKMLHYCDLEQLGLGVRSTIWRMIKMNQFPAPVRIGVNRVAWPETAQPGALAMREKAERYFLEKGMSPEEVGEIVFKAVQQESFYVLTHDWIKERVRVRMEDILEGRQPSPLPRQALAAGD